MAEKTLEKRIEDAWCTYYELPMEYIHKKRDTANEGLTKRRVLFWLLFTDCGFNKQQIASRYNYTRPPISLAIDAIEFERTKRLYIARDIQCIRDIAKEPIG